MLNLNLRIRSQLKFVVNLVLWFKFVDNYMVMRVLNISYFPNND